MSQTETWTVLRLLEWTTQFLRDRGAESPRLDAEVLLAEARGCRRIELYTAFDQVPSDDARTRFREMVRRRADGVPVAYLVGRREFYSLSFRVTPDVLIPRPETELLLIRLLDLIKARAAEDSAAAIHVADVGTGSGVLAICAATASSAAGAERKSNLQITAIDVSAAALTIAKQNAGDHKVADRITFVEGDLLAPLAAKQSLDFVVSNPPYVKESEWRELSREVRDCEPKLALVAGERGTEVIERLIPQAAERLRASGYLLTEISPMIEAHVRRLIEADSRFEPPTVLKDLAGHARMVQARRK
ncbi:MAG TPA: peptide chain release factor N(5)-glutamine methyltransferase [Pirellulales bacterium]